MWVVISQFVGSLNKRKRWRKCKFSLSSLAGASIFVLKNRRFLGLPTLNLHQQPPGSQAFRMNWITIPDFLILQLADGILWDSSVSIITWANSHNKYPLINTYIYYMYIYKYKYKLYVYILLVLFLWRTLTNILFLLMP